MPDPVRCEQCGNAVAENSPAGLCATCLLRTAIEQGAGQTLATLLPRLRYFGDYELLEEIARGGMGVVYRAKQVSLDRTVAVKMMRPGLLATDVEIRRFQAEARTAASLQHPNIVAIHEVGEFDGLHYFSMDFVEGPSLAALVRERPLSPDEAARHVQTLAETVEYAHSRGVLHRDLKPSNVLLDAGGRPRITDFGLARPLDGDHATLSGAIVGTPAYMPPEQAAGESARLSAASDVYSLGAILYELLTGVPPFRGSSQLEIVRRAIEEEPLPPSKRNPAVGPELDAICLRCLRKDPAARYQTAGELAAELAAPVPLRGMRRPGGLRHVVLWAATAVAVVVLLAVLAFAILRTERRRVAERQANWVSVTETRPITPKIAAIPPTRPPSVKKKAATARVERPQLPVAVSISPARGAGYSQIFHFRYDDPKGADRIGRAEIAFRDGTRGCYLTVEPGSGHVSLQVQPGRGPLLRVAGDAGSLTRLDNPVCMVDLAGVVFKKQGIHLDVGVPVTFKRTFDGVIKVTSLPWDMEQRRYAEREASGEWRVGAAEGPPK